MLGSLQVTILADSDYYSRSEYCTKCVENPNSPFLNFNVRLADAHKTGLGSSAALVTALASAILKEHFFHIGEDIPIREFKKIVHNLSQISHCAAQGNVGSGFDIAAAVFGSCVYRRFSPSILEKVGELGSCGFSAHLRSIVDDQKVNPIWDVGIQESAATIPQGLRLVMCDVNCGTETPSMVKKVIAWKKQFPECAYSLWQTIQQGTDRLISELQRLCLQPTESLDNLRDIILEIRSLTREMSARANVPIEPDVQSSLIDACSSIEGIVGGVVPGAGGYDAIVLIVEDRAEVLQKLRKFLQGYSVLSGDDVGAKIRQVHAMDVTQDSQGLKLESPEQYAGWL
ncbi:MAG: hypothetical protein LQ340_006248 [Diploschistes diacapsis]|nr:MAG: hypothetical protein LQ340_006248 [Diploschistes diacapsis]